MRYSFKIKKWTDIDTNRIISENPDARILIIDGTEAEQLVLVKYDGIILDLRVLHDFGREIDRHGGYIFMVCPKSLTNPLIKYVKSCKPIPEDGMTINVSVVE